MPEISVLMSVYNGEEYIKETVDCILNQSFRDFEFIIINDGSTDDTEAIIKSFHDLRLRYFRLAENSGVGKALNYGLQYVQGKYVAKADADDLYSSDRLVIQKKFLDEHLDISLVGSFIEYFPHNKNVETSKNYFDKKNMWEKRKNTFTEWKDISEVIYWYCCLTHSSIMIRSEALQKFRYREFPMGEDYDLFYRLNKAGHRMAIIDRVLTRVRVLEKSTTVTNSNLFLDEIQFEMKKDEIESLFNKSNKVYIWGAGSLGEKVLNNLYKNNLDIEGFIDSNSGRTGAIVHHKKIYLPDILNQVTSKTIVASHPGLFEITRYLKNHGFHHLRDYVVY